MELLHYPSIFSALRILTSSLNFYILATEWGLETHKQADLDFLFLVSFPHLQVTSRVRRR
jgi:hypothetical protein